MRVKCVERACGAYDRSDGMTTSKRLLQDKPSGPAGRPHAGSSRLLHGRTVAQKQRAQIIARCGAAPPFVD
jgi:hypothetical protein